jgi:hypothetical protein
LKDIGHCLLKCTCLEGLNKTTKEVTINGDLVERSMWDLLFATERGNQRVTFYKRTTLRRSAYGNALDMYLGGTRFECRPKH